MPRYSFPRYTACGYLAFSLGVQCQYIIALIWAWYEGHSFVIVNSAKCL